jgi:selenocysteine lyase/cysteine desulfurase
MLTARLSDGLRSNRLDLPETNVRAPHILSIGFRDGMPEKMIENLAAEQIHVAPRLGRIRVSPHVYNDESDIDRFIEAFRRLMPGG